MNENSIPEPWHLIHRVRLVENNLYCYVKQNVLWLVYCNDMLFQSNIINDGKVFTFSDNVVSGEIKCNIVFMRK